MTFAAVAITLLSPTLASAQRTQPTPNATGVIVNNNASVLTYHNNAQRTGVNSNETAFISTGINANMNANAFGKIWSRPVDGTIYTQPLYVPNVQFPNVPDIANTTTKNGIYNAVFVCTTHNSVYAFDAGGSTQITRATSTSTAVRQLPLWQTSFNFANAQISPVPLADIGTEELSPEIGITGTPVIDIQTDRTTGRNKGTLYVVVKTKEGNGYAQRLHALDISTGLERPGSPVLIGASVPGNGDGAIQDAQGRSVVVFDPLTENQEAALTLANAGTANALLYVTWGSHANIAPYHGWVMAFNPSTLKLVGAFNTSPNSNTSTFPAGAGIWQGGAGPAVDEAGNIYFATGSGIFDVNPSSPNFYAFGNSILKFHLPSSGPIWDWFTPFDSADLSNAGIDVGSGGVIVLPNVGNARNPRMVVSVGEAGKIYLLNRDTGHMGKAGATDDGRAVQVLEDAVGPVYGLPAVFNNTLYVQGTGDVLKAIPFVGGVLSSTPTSTGPTAFAFPGATPVVTSSPNGTNGIVWTLERFTPPSILPGFVFSDPDPVSVLHASDASNVANELYNGLKMGSRDLATSALYTPPTVVNGRAYVGGANELVAYGNFQANGIAPGSTPTLAQADHYVITGPNDVSQGAGNWYSITAIGPDNNPVKLSGTVHLSYRFFNGGTTNIGTLNFNDPVKGPQSNILFQYAFRDPGLFEFYANDDFGHSTLIPDIDILPSGTLFPEIFARGSQINGPDHLVITAPVQAKAGSKINIGVKVVTGTNTPYAWPTNNANFYSPAVFVSFTLPQGTQGSVFDLPVFAYDDTSSFVPFTIGSSTANVSVTVPGVGNHVLIVSGVMQYLFGTDPNNPTFVISYPITGTAKVVGIP